MITSSSKIIRYLDTLTPNNPLIPLDIKYGTEATLIESWADNVLAISGQKIFIQELSINKELRTALSEENMHHPWNLLLDSLPNRIINGINKIINHEQTIKLINDLLMLSQLVQSDHWSIGNKLSIDDLAMLHTYHYLNAQIQQGENFVEKAVKGLKMIHA